MGRVVVDASAALEWLFQDKATKATRRLGTILEESWLVAPWIWRLEVVNAVLVRERRKMLTEAQGGQILALLDEWDVQIVGEPEGRTLAALALTARPHQLSAYDAAYLELAVSLGLPVCTLDTNLRQACARLGLSVLPKGR